MKPPKHPSSFPAAEAGTDSLPKLNSDDDEVSARNEATATNIAIMPIGASNLTLTIVAGENEGRVFPIDRDELWIGRAAECEVMLPDRGVSRRHASILRRGPLVLLRDNETKNGTFVNNRQVTEHELHSGDEIQFGSSVCLLFADADNLQRLQHHRTARVRVLAERMHTEKLESIASMVAGVAHEINTPLGVANTANAIISQLAEEVRRAPSSDKLDELLADLKASTGLVTKNLERADALVRTFRQLSASSPSDERAPCDLGVVLLECMHATQAEAEASGIVLRAVWTAGRAFAWLGFQERMCQVAIHLVQNALRHGYPTAQGGVVEIRLHDQGDHYRIEVADDGVGIPSSVYTRMFEPFVTTKREKGSLGLGLAIVYNLVTNSLGGTITCVSNPGTGTKFIVTVPIRPERGRLA